MATSVYLERGKTKIVACSLDWPGWCRFGKTEEAALAALAASAPRYRVIAERAGMAFAPGDAVVVERVTGDATTDWGAPSIMTAMDRQPVDAAEAARGVALLRAAWAVMDDVAAATPAELRKGPRGGGRERDTITAHVVDVERAYARKVGVAVKPFALDDRAALAAMRDQVAAALGSASGGDPLAQKGWPARYATRRFTWHVIDHIWEMEDRRP